MALREFVGELDDPADGESDGRAKKGVKLAGGGFLGGNLGIALGAGVQEMSRQRQLDRLEADQRLANEVAAVAKGVEQEQLSGYTPEQAAQLHAYAEAKNQETGKSIFNVEHDGSKYVVHDAPGEIAQAIGSGKLDSQFSGGQPANTTQASSSRTINQLDGSKSPSVNLDIGDAAQPEAQDKQPQESLPRTAIGREVRSYLEAKRKGSLEIAPVTQFKLGSRVQDRPFTQTELDGERLARMSEAFILAGRPDKAGQVDELLRKRQAAADEAERQAILAKAGEGGVDNLLKVAPDIAFEYIRTGDVEKAKKFMDFAESMDGREYARTYAKAHHLTTIGDYEGAIPIFEKLYNELYPDGREVRLHNLGNGKYRTDFIDKQTGGVVGSQELPVSQLARDAVSALSPTKLVDHLVAQNAKRDSEDHRQQWLAERESQRDERVAKRQRDTNVRRADLSPAEKRQKLDALTVERNALLKAAVQDAQAAQKTKGE